MTDVSAAQRAWDSTSIVRGLSADQQMMYFGELDKHESRNWISRKAGTGSEKVMRITQVNEDKNTKAWPVSDCTRSNRVSPPASNSQLSTAGAVRKLRGLLKPGMVVRQRDLDQAFLRMRVAVFDENGDRVYLELRAPGRMIGRTG